MRYILFALLISIIFLFQSCSADTSEKIDGTPIYDEDKNIIIVINDRGEYDGHGREYNIRYKPTKSIIEKINSVSGVKYSFLVGKYSVIVVKGKAFFWDEINPSVIEILYPSFDNIDE